MKTSSSRRAWWLPFLTLTVILSAAGCYIVSPSTPTERPAANTVVPTPSSTPSITPTPTPLFTATPTPTLTPTVPPTSTPQPTSTPTLTPTPTPRPTVPSPEALATQYPELAPILNNPEVSSVYKDLAVAYEQGGQQAVLAAARQRGLVTPEGDIRVDLVLDTSDTAGTVAQLEAMGIKVVGAHGNVVEIAVPPALLMSGANQPGAAFNQLSGLEHVVGVQPPQ